MKRSSLTKILVVSALCVCINFAGTTIARVFELPIYLDTIGTIFGAVVMGPFWGSVIGLISALISSVTVDPTSFFFAPVQIVVGLLTGYFFKNHKFEGFKSVVEIIIITLAGSIISSVIATFVFSGITSSGSAYLVQGLKLLGVNLLTSVFSTQIVTDLIDKGISFWLVFMLIKVIPKKYLSDL